jgi:ligand-binding SRPBCC domain-containing protein
VPKTKIFVHQSVMPGTLSQLIAFHEAPDVFSRLAMPPLVFQVLRDTRASLTEGELSFRLWFGPVPLRWRARHERGPVQESFRDVQVEGPMEYWEHDHIFERAESGVRLTDRVTLAHKPGWRGLLTRLLFDGPPLRMLFVYRHWQTRRALRKMNFLTENGSA